MTESSCFFDLEEKESITDSVVRSGPVLPSKKPLPIITSYKLRFVDYSYLMPNPSSVIYPTQTLDLKSIVTTSGTISSLPTNSFLISMEEYLSLFFPTQIEAQSSLMRNEENASSSIDSIRQSCKAILNSKDWFLQKDVATSFMKQLDIKLDYGTWDPEDKFPSIQSFYQLVLFHSHYFELKPSSITISNSGFFVATWYRSQRELVRLEFQPDGWVQWLVFLEPVGYTGPSRKGTGFEKNLNVKKMLEQQYRSWSWMSR